MAGIAIVTGASSGLGREYVRQIVKQKPDIQEIWLIARRREKLEAVAAEFPEKNFAIFSLDLAEKESFEILRSSLEQKKPNVEILINNSGFGKLGYFEEIPLEQEAGMVDVNIRAMVCLTHIVLPYMNSGAVILNTCSIAAYIPNPRMTVYSSTKAFVFSFSRLCGRSSSARISMFTLRVPDQWTRNFCRLRKLRRANHLCSMVFPE